MSSLKPAPLNLIALTFQPSKSLYEPWNVPYYQQTDAYLTNGAKTVGIAMANEGGLTDREAAIDAVIRFVCSLDEGDAELCASSLTSEAVLDMSPFQKLGWNSGSTEGRTQVVDLLMNAVGTALDTTHSATNIRCTVHGGTATLTCWVLAQHFRRGEGPSPEFQDYYLFCNKYESSIVREGALWRIAKLTITPKWTQGNPDVLKSVANGR